MFLHSSTWNSEEVQVKRTHLFSKIDSTTLFHVDISRQRADFAYGVPLVHYYTQLSAHFRIKTGGDEDTLSFIAS
jgi:hypothetical protein